MLFEVLGTWELEVPGNWELEAPGTWELRNLKFRELRNFGTWKLRNSLSGVPPLRPSQSRCEQKKPTIQILITSLYKREDL